MPEVLRLIVIEDTEMYRKALVNKLAAEAGETLQVRIHAAGTLEDGLALIASQDADAIVLDPGLPGHSAAQVIKRVHEAASDKGIPVIGLTGGLPDQAAEDAAALLSRLVIKGEMPTRGIMRSLFGPELEALRGPYIDPDVLGAVGKAADRLEALHAKMDTLLKRTEGRRKHEGM